MNNEWPLERRGDFPTDGFGSVLTLRIGVCLTFLRLSLHGSLSCDMKAGRMNSSG